MSNLSTLPKGDSAWLLRKAIERIIQQVSVLETNIGSSTTGNSANTQVIFNDAGTLRGDPAFVFDAATDMLSVTGFKTFLTTQLSTIGTLYVGTLATPKLKVDVAGTGITTITQADITGDLTVRTTGLTVNSSGVGIGTSSQSSFLGNSPKKLVIGDGTQTPALTLYGGSANVSGIYFADGTVGNEAYRGFIEYDHATDSFNFGKAGGSAMILNASGNLAFPTGKGIDFSATPDGTLTVNSELLNDYEEGTWTATLKGTVSDPTTPVTATGRYTKIGRVVSVQVFFSGVTTTGASGRIQIDGLPFTNNSSIVTVGTAAFNRMATFTGVPFASLAASSTTIIMFSSNSAADYTAVLFNAGTTQDLWVSLNYTVA